MDAFVFIDDELEAITNMIEELDQSMPQLRLHLHQARELIRRARERSEFLRSLSLDVHRLMILPADPEESHELTDTSDSVSESVIEIESSSEESS